MAKIQNYRMLGASGLSVSSVGIGTNKWNINKNDEMVLKTFKTAMDIGINFFDTAEMYAFGKSEKLLGDCLQKTGQNPVIATKMLPMPFRSFHKALDASLSRLGVKSIDLYYIHFPTGNIEKLMDQMAEAVERGKIRAVGVSNFSADQMYRAVERLKRYNIPLAANEVQYNLLHRQPEINGVLKACQELNVAMVSYFPLNSGQMISGLSQSDASSASKKKNGKGTLKMILSEIADNRGKSISQVVLNWLLQKDEHIIPIPGTTKVEHIVSNAETLNWALDDKEFALIDQVSAPAGG